MDELLQEFLTETGENLDTVDRELVRFEQDPNDRDILRNIFRLVHTVKGTCGFIGLPRLEALTHAAESVIGQFRDGATVKPIAVTAILETIDRIKDILAELLPRNPSIQIFRALLESNASEHGARISAMDNATRNAGEMIGKLTITYNRTRQAQITKELIEIISGAEAL